MSGDEHQRGEEPVLDPRQILDTIGDDTGAIREFIEIAVADLGPAAAQLSEALAGGDLPRAAKAAHSIKGVVGSLGGRCALETARQLEQRAKAGDAGASAALLRRLEEDLKRLRSALDAHPWCQRAGA